MKIQFDCPDELLTLSGQDQATISKLAQEAFLVRLYELGQISSGRGAEILHISRREFLDLLGRYGISIFEQDIDLESEARCGR